MDLVDHDLIGLRELIARRAVSSGEVVEAYIERIAQVDPAINGLAQQKLDLELIFEIIGGSDRDDPKPDGVTVWPRTEGQDSAHCPRYKRASRAMRARTQSRHHRLWRGAAIDASRRNP